MHALAVVAGGGGRAVHGAWAAARRLATGPPDDPAFRTRALLIKEQRSELVKHHLWVLWTDYFKPPHFEKYPQLNQWFNEATKLAGGGGGTKSSTDVATADALLAKIDDINKIFWETKQG